MAKLRDTTSYCTGNGVREPSTRESHILLYGWAEPLREHPILLTEGHSTSGLVLYSHCPWSLYRPAQTDRTLPSTHDHGLRPVFQEVV